MVNSANLVLNSVLCYVSSALETKTLDTIIDCCVPFFEYGQLREAKETLLLYCEHESETSNRRGNKSAKCLVTEVIEVFKYCKINNIELPSFVANSYNSMPPMSGYEIIGGTLSALIEEIYVLKEEIIALKHNNEADKKCLDNISIKSDLIEIKKTLKDIKFDNYQHEIRRVSLTPASLLNKINNESLSKMPMSSLSSEKTDLDLNKFEDLFLNECNEPSAPTLSQLQDESASLPDLTSNEINNFGRHVQPDKTYSYMAALKPKPKPVSNIQLNDHKKLPTIVVTNNHINKSRHKNVDEDGFTRIASKRKMTTGSKKTFENVSFKSANRLIELYVGRCEDSCTSDMLKDYLVSEVGVTPKECIQIETKVKFASAFRLTINFNDKDKLFNSDSWPEGVVCRRFYPGKS